MEAKEDDSNAESGDEGSDGEAQTQVGLVKDSRSVAAKPKLKKKKKFVYNRFATLKVNRPIGMCTVNCKYPVVRRVARRLGFREV
jgi:hypothetical protein